MSHLPNPIAKKRVLQVPGGFTWEVEDHAGKIIRAGINKATKERKFWLTYREAEWRMNTFLKQREAAIERRKGAR